MRPLTGMVRSRSRRRPIGTGGIFRISGIGGHGRPRLELLHDANGDRDDRYGEHHPGDDKEAPPPMTLTRITTGWRTSERRTP
ncbi:MAG TPA: hypothetical protein VF225_10500, partial [Gaiellaceae bacterium]